MVPDAQPLPLISVILPVYDEARFIRQSLLSVLNQEYPPDRLEVIVVDGGSTDGTREVVRDLAARTGRVKLVDNASRIAASALNLGLDVARGTIFLRVDGHSEIASDYVRRCVSHIEDGHLVVGGVIETVGEIGMGRTIALVMSSRFGVGDAGFRVGVQDARLVDTVPFAAYHRSVFERAGRYDENVGCNEDDELNYRLRKLGIPILLAPDVRSRYYCRDSLPALWRQYFRYGYWKVRVLQKHPRQMQLRQFVPPLFVGALLGSLLVSLLWPVFCYVALFIALAYAAADLVAAAFLAANHGVRHGALSLLVYPTLHFAYGTGFLAGLFRFGFTEKLGV